MSENGYLDKASLLSMNKRRYRDIDVPGLGKIRIRSLTERERSQLEASAQDDLPGLKVRLIIFCVCNADGHSLFSDADRTAIGAMDAIVTNAIVDACQQHCGITGDNIEELVKNFGKTTGGDSPSD